MKIHYTYSFYPDREKGNDIDGKLRMRISWSNNRASINVGYRVEFSKWSKDAQRCKTNTTHGKKHIPAYDINKSIAEHEELISSVFYFFESKGITPDATHFRSKFNELCGKSPSNGGFDAVLNQFIEVNSSLNSWQSETIRKFRTIAKKMNEFKAIKETEDINEQYIQKYIVYQQEKGYRNTTIQKELKYIYWFLRWANKNNLYSQKIFDTFRPRLKTIDKEVIYLSWEELTHLYSFEFDTDSLSQVRDVFCFCCFTSLRYSDVKKLKKIDIYDDKIHVVTKKTNDSLIIELNNYSRSILSKYQNIDFPSGSALPVISNQRMNDYLKIMAQKAGIDTPLRLVYFIGNERHEDTHPKYELITTHCGRRTFVVNALFLGISPEVVISWTGHKDYDAMKPYIKIVDELKQQSMDKFNI